MRKETEVKIELTKKEFYNLVGNSPKFNREITFGYFKKDFSNINDGIFPRIKYVNGEKKEIIFTVKRKTKNNTQFFEREEIEIKINGKKENVDTLREMLKCLGFAKEIIFEKKRKNIFKKDISISFDKLPFGFFVEFEGTPKKIGEYLRKFHLEGKNIITKAYLGIWEDYKNKKSIRIENCLFSGKIKPNHDS